VPPKSLGEFGATGKPIGTGRFRFKSSELRASVEAVADTGNYRGRPGIDRVIWSIAPSTTAATKLLGGEADVFAAVRRENLPDIAKHSELTVRSMPGTEFAFMVFNLRRPPFESVALRRALTMAIDRPSIIRSVFDTLAVPAIGPTVRVFPTTNTVALREIPFDPDRAKAVLDSLGWKIDSKTGIRAKGGKALDLTTIVPSTSAPRIAMAVLIQEQLRRAGVKMNVEKMDFGVFQSRLAGRDFDAAISNLIFGAEPNALKESWGVEAARSKGGRNFGGYINPRFDSEVDSAVAARRLDDARRHFTNAYQTIIDDAPAVWLSEPKVVLGLRRSVKPARMRPDAWWYDLGDWSISSAER
jgi:peptide/nickel transport system substrate-binding protein